MILLVLIVCKNPLKMSYFNDFVVWSTFIGYFRWVEASFNYIFMPITVGVVWTKDQLWDRILDGLYGKLCHLRTFFKALYLLQFHKQSNHKDSKIKLHRYFNHSQRQCSYCIYTAQLWRKLFVWQHRREGNSHRFRLSNNSFGNELECRHYRC